MLSNICDPILGALLLLFAAYVVAARISTWRLLTTGRGLGGERSVVPPCAIAALALLPVLLLPASLRFKDLALGLLFALVLLDFVVGRGVWRLWAWWRGHGLTALHRAVIERDLGAAEAALDDGVSTEAKAMLWRRAGVLPGDTALHLALRREDWEMARLLLRRGADPEALCSWGPPWDPLHWAVAHGTMADLEAMESAGADLNKRNCYHQTALFCVREAEQVELLLSAGAGPMDRDSQGQTPLHTVQTGSGVAALLAAGADPTARDHWDRTPLHRPHDPDAIRALLSAGADPTACDSAGMTPLHVVRSGAGAAALLAAGADPGACGTFRGPPRHPWGTLAITREALAERGSQRAYGEPGGTPLHAAVWRDDVGTVQALLRAGADATASDDEGTTPLHAAGSAEVLHLLLEAGAAANAVNNRGQTPLHWAVLRGKLEVVRGLLAAGADPRIRDSWRKRPVQYARWRPKTWRAMRRAFRRGMPEGA
ncbi:MAG: ankyrin repeat domain-containing protein [Armatimonadia bacterium]